ncbi:hypothetical protein HPP92_002082 [Vanilla planifolia]|uniref:Hexosyltransferase n=1 Tax=Vanilla planifolia TaxID=51239 RepID=A0A835S0J3_VANPL|nr:hypothetical protein HPP92_002082 [Vanilla planifolia]
MAGGKSTRPVGGLVSSSQRFGDGASSSAEASAVTIRRTFLALNSDPLQTRLDLIYRQASDHLALVHAYAAYARRLKLENSRQLRLFEDLASSFSNLASRIDADASVDEDAIRPLEKEAKDRIKLARQLVSEHKESFDTQLKIQKLRDDLFAVGEQLNRARKLSALSSSIAAGSTPEEPALHRDAADGRTHFSPETYRRLKPPDLSDPELYHYVIFTNNIIAVSVVVNSAIKNAKEPQRHVFHVVTDQMYAAAMQVWFTRRPPANGAKVEVRSVSEFGFLNATYSPVVRQIEGGRRDLVLLEYLRFYLPEMFPKLRRIIYLEDDVVVQKDLAKLWAEDLEGKVNGAVEMCFGSFRRYSRFINFSHPVAREKFTPRACAWNYGVNLFDLDAWRREKCTLQFHRYQNLVRMRMAHCGVQEMFCRLDC